MFHLFKRKSPRLFLTRQESRVLAEKVAGFKRETGCEIVFHLRRRLGSDPILFNRRLFHHHGLHEAKDKRGILITLALKDRRFAVWVDAGIEKHAGEELRTRICRSLEEHLKAGRHLDAFLDVLTVAGGILKPHMQGQP